MIRNGSGVVLLAAISLFACSHDRETMTPASHTASTPEPSPDKRALSDAQITDILEAVNTAEIQQGTIAQQNARRQEVRDYATMMVTDHSKSLDEVQRLASKAGFGRAGSELSSELRSDNQETISELKQAKPEDFDEEYIESQLEAHEETLKLLDEKLIPNADNPDLRASLLATRPVVVGHLDRARSIQRMLD
jgi:putative membrane protein